MINSRTRNIDFLNEWVLKGLLIFLACCLVSVAKAQNFYHFSHLTIQNGLINNTVTDVVQDQKGYIWIATLGGLQQYDGIGYLIFTSENSALPSNVITKLFCDDSGWVWIITSGGICLYDPAFKKFSRVSVEHSTEEKIEPVRFYEDEQQTLWITTRQGYLFFFDKERRAFVSGDKKWAPRSFPVFSLTQQPAIEKYWLSSQDKLIQYDAGRKTYKRYDLDSALQSTLRDDRVKNIQSLHQDKHRLWISLTTRAGKNHTYYWTGKNEWVPVAGIESSSPVHTFITTLDGTAWAIGKSAWRNRNDRWESVAGFEEVPYDWKDAADFVRCMTEDRDGTLWAGTDNGLFIFMPQAHDFTYFPSNLLSRLPIPSDSASQRSFQMLPVLDKLWVLSFGHAGAEIFDAQFQPLAGAPGLAALQQEPVSSVFQDGEGTLWAGAEGKLIRLNAVNGAVRKFGLDIPAITCMAGSANTELLWVATGNGLIGSWLKKQEQFRLLIDLNAIPGIEKSEVMALIPDDDFQLLWVITDRRIFRISMNGHYEASYAIGEEVRIRQVIDYDVETLLVATDKGLFTFLKERGKAHLISTPKGYFQYDVTGVVLDHLHQVWVTTRGNGLFRLSSSLREVKRYGTPEGVVYSNFHPAGNVLLDNDKVVLATTHGLLVFDPFKTPAPFFNPRVQIVSFRVNDVEMIDSLKEGRLSLTWNQNSVSILFSSMSFVYKDQADFSYRLEGQDHDWLPATQGEKIKYTNLPPGDYTFFVRSKALTGDVVTDETSVRFTIVSPFWKTMWFKGVLVMVCIFLVCLVVWIRQERQERIRKIQNKIARDLHDNIGSSLSSINIMVSVAQASLARKPEQTSAVLTKISEAAHLTQENLHDIVWSIPSGHNSMKHIISRMREFMVSLFEGREVRTEFLFPEEFEHVDMPLEKRYDFYLVFKEMVNNGAKYSEATAVSVKIEKAQEIISLQYEDNGTGFDVQHASSGNGLANMRQRARSLEGQLTIFSAPGKGTRIRLTFPV